ncbi:uncharacterized protein LOC127167112 isoform X2 [Labeo rohita]|uniref:uncharacterized protein LOC127167112 isoform X2 n=1 Tax=Labeo rohita TaxID=84645 RepID=UPI0021E3120F|nr:uncharacterized protein LOC127167112 isoform X2 [Labeo rohita]
MASFQTGFIRAPIPVMLYVLACITVTESAAYTPVDPCYNYTVLDDPWRATNIYTSVDKCDQSFAWSGWYRLFINNVSTQIPDTCVAQYSCGTAAPLWIRGGHPTVQDGVVSRDVCAHWNNLCCFFGSYPIKVKACPGKYYVYELVSPSVCNSAYCAAVFPSVDPCYNYTVLDNPWRANSSQLSNSYKCDRDLTSSGWYRLFVNNISAQIPDTCVAKYSCGTHVPLWIRGGHPTVQDGVVTRDVCGHWINYCCFFGSYPIKVKACPGKYYVYELVRPTVCNSAYCAVVNNISSTITTVAPETTSAAYTPVDPCYNYTVLDDPWRATNIYTSVDKCDQSVAWSGWYRLFINNVSTQIPDTCVAQYSCGTAAPLWIRGGHPTVQDGVVTRDVCAHWNNLCCYFGSYPIKVKACPGKYYVYELVRPTVCNSAYCAAVLPSVDPCYNYTVLDDPWRANSSQLSNSYKCDRDLTSSGWYRLFINNISAQIPDTCVAKYSCGTHVPLWIRGGHPTVQDGVVTRDVCGHWINYCCFFGSYPIKVKACPGKYYVYELVRPTVCYSAYCAVVNNISSTITTVAPETTSAVVNNISSTVTTVTPKTTSAVVNNISSTVTTVTPKTTSAVVNNISSTVTTVTPKTTSAGINLTLPEECISQTSKGCFENLLEQTENITAQVLPLNAVMNILNMVFNASVKIVESTSSPNPTELASYGNRVLKTSEKLISTLVTPTDTNDSVNFTLAAVEGQVFMVGPNVMLNRIPQLNTTYCSVDIDLIGIAKNNNERSAAVAFMSYIMMENLLKPDFFNTSNGTVKTMMSTVISVTLPKTTNTKLTKPVNFTFRHIREFDPNGSLSCVYWNISKWIVDGCSVLKTNSSYTVCSCDHLSTFSIVQTSRPPESGSSLVMLALVCVIVGLVFFSLALLGFVLYKWSPVRDWIRGRVMLGPEGYRREELHCSTRSASDVSAVDSKQSNVSQETPRTTTSF